MSDGPTERFTVEIDLDIHVEVERKQLINVGEGGVVHGRLLGDEAVEGTGDDLPDSQAATARYRNDIQQILLWSYSVNRSHKNLITIVVVS